MKKFEEAELKVTMVENSVIVTSGGCAPSDSSPRFTCQFRGAKYSYDSNTNVATLNEPG